MLFQTVVGGRKFVMDNVFATATAADAEQPATPVPAGQPESPTQTIVAVPAGPSSPGSGLALTIDVTTIATVGLVLAFSYSIVKTFRDKA